MGNLEEAKAKVRLSADIIACYAEHAEDFLAPEKLDPESGAAHIESSPPGVLFGVQPWNFSYYQLARFAGPNLI
jgi:succinate-semialdehyde dehydrogenase / glutarate-semialdehyde dehydrogenase